MSASPWRPIGPEDLDQLRHLIRRVLEEWEQRWFGREILEVSAGTYLPASSVTPTPGQDPHHAVGLRIHEAAARALCQLALDTDVSPGPGPAEAIVATLRAAISADLAHVVHQHLGCKAPTRSSLPGSVQFLLRIPGDGVSIELEIGAQQALLLLPETPRQDGPRPAVPVREALGDLTVSIEARLGTAVLTLGELKHLEAGDIIRLSTHLEQPADLRLLAGKRKVELGTAHIKQSNGAFSLEIDSLSSRS